MIKDELKARIMVLKARETYHVKAVEELERLNMAETSAYTILDTSLQHLNKRKKELEYLLEIE